MVSRIVVAVVLGVGSRVAGAGQLFLLRRRIIFGLRFGRGFFGRLFLGFRRLLLELGLVVLLFVGVGGEHNVSLFSWIFFRRFLRGDDFRSGRWRRLDRSCFNFRLLDFDRLLHFFLGLFFNFRRWFLLFLLNNLSFLGLFNCHWLFLSLWLSLNHSSRRCFFANSCRSCGFLNRLFNLLLLGLLTFFGTAFFNVLFG